MTEILMDGMNAEEYLADMNRELCSMGIKPVASIEEARRTGRPATNADLFATAAEQAPRSGGMTEINTYRASANYATDAQVNFMVSLAQQIADANGVEFDEANVRHLFGKLTKRNASAKIDELKIEAATAKQAAAQRARTARSAAPVAGVTEDGMYRKDGVIYKVQIAKQGSGRLYAKVLVQDGNETYFEYAPGAVRQLRPEDKMSLAEAKEFGHLYGVCCVCAAELTDEKSIAAGIGPVCAKKF